MGCCMSSPATSNHHQKHPSTTTTQFPNVSKSPPRAEEETVKEVLSETPKPKPQLIPKISKQNLQEHPTTVLPNFTTLLSPTKPDFGNPVEEHKSHKNPVEESQPRENPVQVLTPDEVSEVSEICSLTESLSTTTNFTEKREDENGEICQRVHRSPAKSHRNGPSSLDLSLRRERPAFGRSPVRRSDPSPPRRRNVGSGVGLGPGQGAVRRGVGVGGDGGQRKRDPAENSGRRSRSPVTRVEANGGRANVGRIPSVRKTGRSPGRVRMVQPQESSRKMEENREEEEEEEEAEERMQIPNESLDNPLVSLECFIFL